MALFLAIGRIVKTQGRRGEVAAEPLTDFPERFQGLRQAFLESSNRPPKPVTVESVWPHKGRIVVKFSGVDSIDQAQHLVGLHILIPKEERMPLPPHHYYVWELKGCQVVTEREGVQSKVGTVTDVEPTGGVDLLRVVRSNGSGEDVLIPLAQTICTRIDPEAKTIVIDPPEDLLELNE